MSTPGRGPQRWLRAGLLAALTVLVSIGGHALAGGSVHLSLPLLLGGAALGALCVAAADVRRSFAEILAVVLLAQPVLHLLAAMGGHGHAAAAPGPDPAVTGGPAIGGLGIGGLGMVLAHIGAALLVSVLLADAERAVWTLAGLLAPLLTPLLAPLRLPHAARRVLLVPVVVPVADRGDTPLLRRLLGSALRRRGPPVVAGAS